MGQLSINLILTVAHIIEIIEIIEMGPISIISISSIIWAALRIEIIEIGGFSG